MRFREIYDNQSLVHKDQSTILVSFAEAVRDWKIVTGLARQYQWRFLDLHFRDGHIPANLNVRGAIVDRLPTDPLVQELLKRGCPVVRIGSLPHPDDALVPAVMSDRQAIGRLAAQYFHQCGLKNVGYVGHTPLSDAGNMFKGLKSKAEENGSGCHLLQVANFPVGKRTHAERYAYRRDEFAEWLAKVPKPLGLLAYSDEWGARLCWMCDDLDIAVPEEVAVLGVGNRIPIATHSQITLSSIQIDNERIWKTAASMLQKLMRGQSPAETTVKVPSCDIVVRESTDTLASSDRHVVAAMIYLRQHLRRNLSVAEVAEAVGIPRRSLERKFENEVGHGVNAELQRRRLRELCRLLRSTELPIASLGPMSGFPSATHLNRSFLKAFGISPLKFRQREQI